MRLTRVNGPPQESGLLVAEDIAPAAVRPAPLVDYEATFLAEHRRMHAPLMSYAERFLGKDDGADAVADTWEDVWRRWPALVRERPSESYYFSAVYYQIRARRKAGRNLVSLDEAEEEIERVSYEVAPRPARADTKAELVAAAIAAMPERRRAVILLIKEQGMTYEQTAHALGLSMGTVNTHMRLAMEDIRAAVARAGQAVTQLAPPEPPRLPSPTGGDHDD